MSSIGTLYTIDRQDYGKRVRSLVSLTAVVEESSTISLQVKAVAAWLGLPLDVASGFVFGETNKSPEYRAKFPHGKIPAFEGVDGFKLFETQAITRYREFASIVCPSPAIHGDLRMMRRSQSVIPVLMLMSTANYFSEHSCVLCLVLGNKLLTYVP